MPWNHGSGTQPVGVPAAHKPFKTVNIMKEGKVKKARRKDSPKPAEPQSGARRTVKLLPGAEALAKPLPRKRAAPTSTRARSALKPLKTLQSHLSGVLGLPRPAPNLL